EIHGWWKLTVILNDDNSRTHNINCVQNVNIVAIDIDRKQVNLPGKAFPNQAVDVVTGNEGCFNTQPAIRYNVFELGIDLRHKAFAALDPQPAPALQQEFERVILQAILDAELNKGPRPRAKAI